MNQAVCMATMYILNVLNISKRSFLNYFFNDFMLDRLVLSEQTTLAKDYDGCQETL